MTPLKSFEEFLAENVAKKQRPNASRAEFLLKESEKEYAFLIELSKKFDINENNSNHFVKSCYDVILELIRAKMLLNGYNATGQGAHEAEVAYMRLLNFKENDIRFVNQIRFFRNGMLYYGTIVDVEYAEKVFEFTKEIYPKLVDL